MNNDIRQTILYWLARRDHSQQEITRKLLAKKFPPDDIPPVIEQLLEQGLIKDSRFAEVYCHSRRNKGFGPLRISMELQARGILPETIAEVLEIADNAWFDQAQRVWQKRFKGKIAKDYADLAKHMRFLQQRGFTKEQIDSVLGRSRD